MDATRGGTSMASSSATIGCGGGGSVHASLHRFLVSEVRSVRFGTAEDASITIIAVLVSSAIAICVLAIASATTGRPLLRLFMLSNQIVAAMLLFAWIAAYSLISLVIWHQFERSERYPADDYYLVPGEGAAESEGLCANVPIVVQLPDDQVGLAVPRNPSK
jgi:hypothetical protein